jgi:hypothetical protein
MTIHAKLHGSTPGTGEPAVQANQSRSVRTLRAAHTRDRRPALDAPARGTDRRRTALISCPAARQVYPDEYASSG